MPKVIIDEKKVEQFLTRGVDTIYPSKKQLKELLMSGKRIKLYCGFDPSADALHIGNATMIEKLSQLQEFGHEVIFLIGDFTGMIGDPTDKMATRKKLTRKEALANAKNYKKQASSYLNFSGKNPAKVMHNSQWLDKLTFKDLIEITSNFTVQQMIQRDMFQRRIKEEKPIHFHEFLYPVAQGYDSVAMDVDLEIGGSDQMFNMMCGRHLQKTINNREKFVLTTKLLEDDKGHKMSKSEGNVVWLNDSAENMFGKVMSWPDGLIGIGFELCTKLSMEKVGEVYKLLKDPKNNPRDLKLELAFEITKIVHGETKAKNAQDDFVAKFQKKNANVVVAEPLRIKVRVNPVIVLTENNLSPSRGEAKRLIQQGGLKIDDQPIKDINYQFKKEDDGKILKVGKKTFRKISIK